MDYLRDILDKKPSSAENCGNISFHDVKDIEVMK